MQLFEKIVKEISGFPHSTLRIHGVGEPVRWQYLSHALEFAAQYNVRTWLFTCLVTEDVSLLEKLVKYCKIIEISINSFNEEEYKTTKGIDAYHQVKHGIEFIRAIAKSKGFSTRIIVSRVESVDKQYDTDFVEYWKNSNLVDDAFVRAYHNYNLLLDNKSRHPGQQIIPCLVHWSRFNIDCDGTVVLCFNELFKGKYADKSLVLGNIADQAIREIWHCDRLNLVRKAQLEKNYNIIDFSDSLPCVSCSSCQPLGESGVPTSEYQIEFTD